jgi:hypothetical protein
MLPCALLNGVGAPVAEPLQLHTLSDSLVACASRLGDHDSRLLAIPLLHDSLADSRLLSCALSELLEGIEVIVYSRLDAVKVSSGVIVPEGIKDSSSGIEAGRISYHINV